MQTGNQLLCGLTLVLIALTFVTPASPRRTMKRTLLFVFGILFLTPTCPGADATDEEKGFVSIFNGKDLRGWDGKPGWWRVEDGAITGESTPEKRLSKHNYLIWRGGKPADFELRLRFRLR